MYREVCLQGSTISLREMSRGLIHGPSFCGFSISPWFMVYLIKLTVTQSNSNFMKCECLSLSTNTQHWTVAANLIKTPSSESTLYA
jgi:hypothetical protein